MRQFDFILLGGDMQANHHEAPAMKEMKTTGKIPDNVQFWLQFVTALRELMSAIFLSFYCVQPLVAMRLIARVTAHQPSGTGWWYKRI